MKKKFISAMLFGALLFASTSAVVSCKDYDDDISSLRTEITTSATDLTSLVNEKVSNLTTEISTLKSQQSALETAYKAADDKLQAAVESAETNANAYADIQAAAAEKAAIEASQAAINDAVEKLEAAIKEANTAISDVDSKYETKVAALLAADEALQAAIDEANGKIAAAQEKADAAYVLASTNAEALSTVSENLKKVETDLNAQIQVVKTDLQKEIAAQKAEVDAQIDVINSTLASNKTAIEALQGADADLLKKINANSEELASLGKTLAGVDAKLEANLSSAKAYTDAQIAALKAELGDSIAACKADIAAANIIIAQNSKAIESLGTTKADKADVQEAVDNLQEQIDKNQETYLAYVASTAKVLDTIQDNVKTNTESIKTLQGLAETIQNDVATNAANIAANKKAIEDLTSDVEDYITTNDAALNALKDAIGDATGDATLVQRIQELEEYIELLKSGDEGVSVSEQVAANKADIQALYEALDAVFGTEEEIEDTPTVYSLRATAANKFATYIQSIKDQIDNLNNQVEGLWQRMETMELGFTQFYNLVNDTIDLLQGHTRLLKSMVFSPYEYYNGIEAIGIYSFNYNPKSLKYAYGAGNTGNNSNQTDDVATNKKQNGQVIVNTVVPYVMASYYLNPSNAIVDTTTAYVKKHFSYLVNTASMTRAITGSNIAIDSARVVNGGLLNVYFSVDDYSKISEGTEGGDNNKVDVAALRYTYSTENGDTVITSDFAALKKYKITNFNINKVSTFGAVDTEASSHNHLFETATKAVEDAAATMRISIKYDNYQDGVDLDEWINVHYDYVGINDKLWGGQSTINKKNFELKYELLGYINPTNNTNESGHATINGSILTVHKVNQPGVKAGQEIVGRRPLIRVTLWDNTKNEIAQVGYILASIEKDATEYSVSMPENTENYQLVCANDDAHVQTTYWQDMEELLLGDTEISKLGMSKSDFELIYELEKTNDNINVYSETNKTTTSAILGTVTEKIANGAQATHVLEWKLNGEQAYNALASSDHVSIYVKYKRKDGSSDAPIWVKLTWKPADKLTTPSATIKPADKVAADWHTAASDLAGYDDVHMQIGSPTSTTTAKFDQLTLDYTFNTTPLNIVKRDLNANGYTKLASSSDLSVTYAFAPLAEQTKQSYAVKQADGSTKTYTISVANDGLSVSATVGSTTEQIATIDESTGKVTLSTNAVATALINNAEFNTDIRDALTFTVKISASTCKPTTTALNGTTISVTNEKFDVRVLKPLYLTGVTAKNMKLNEGTALEQDVTAKFQDFVGYTPLSFHGVNTSGVEFYNFYDIKSYEINLDDVTTDYSGTYRPVDTNKFTIAFNGYTSGKVTVTESQDYNGVAVENTYDANGYAIIGKVKLTQVNMSGANTFHVIIPVTVHTGNGDLVQPMTITVESSNGGQGTR